MNIDGRMGTVGSADMGAKRTVHVDVTEPGSALVTGPGFSARVGRTERSGWFYVEDAATEKPVGEVRTYRAAGGLMAEVYGLSDVSIEVDYE